jgi:hypothetical protein
VKILQTSFERAALHAHSAVWILGTKSEFAPGEEAVTKGINARQEESVSTYDVGCCTPP